MKMYQTPTGCTGSDQVNAMEESVNTQLEQMFHQAAKRNALDYGVGRTTMTSGGAGDTLRLDAQKRECDGTIVFHAGRALELALHIVYARGADRILGRKHPSASKDQTKKIEKDRKTHSLVSLRCRIVNDLKERKMADALEDVYQRALHTGVVDLFVNEELVWSFYHPDDTPFIETKVAKMVSGAEMTLDHSLNPLGATIGPKDQTSHFMEMSQETFEDFLQKADSVYYAEDSSKGKKRKNMRWAHYSSRDHEYGRPYVVIGPKFFARLVRGVIGLSQQLWTWDEGFARRQLERRQDNIRKRVEILVDQNFREKIDLPEMISIDEWLKRGIAMEEPPKMSSKHDYDILHRKWEIRTKPKDGSS